jgi:hypothetical protein
VGRTVFTLQYHIAFESGPGWQAFFIAQTFSSVRVLHYIAE